MEMEVERANDSAFALYVVVVSNQYTDPNR
jgi:hypothetical protein